VDGNCHLVRRWAKKQDCQATTDLIDNSAVQCLSYLRPIIGISPVMDFMLPIIGIPDNGNEVPNSFLFMPPKKEWPDLFVEHMQQLLQNN